MVLGTFRPYSGYQGTIEIVDDELYGEVLGSRPTITYEADSLEGLYNEFTKSIDKFLELKKTKESKLEVLQLKLTMAYLVQDNYASKDPLYYHHGYEPSCEQAWRILGFDKPQISKEEFNKVVDDLKKQLDYINSL